MSRAISGTKGTNATATVERDDPESSSPAQQQYIISRQRNKTRNHHAIREKEEYPQKDGWLAKVLEVVETHS